MSQISQLSVSASVCPTDLQIENHQYHTPDLSGSNENSINEQIKCWGSFEDWERKYLVTSFA